MSAAVLAIDPGTTQSAYMLLADGEPDMFAIEPNDSLLGSLRLGLFDSVWPGHAVVIEQIESYGMAVGREVFETVRWAGRFEEAAQPLSVALMPRRTVKLHLCSSPRANDSNIRAALIDRFGGPAATKKGGPLYRIAKDVWSALAIAVTYSDQLDSASLGESHRAIR